ncbi:MAG: MaoC/PaaZ C-terminal domain-containing protein [Thiohalocapsa sp.]
MHSAAEDFALADLAIGQSAQFEVTVEAADIDRFAALSGDFSPLHIDADFARRRGFPGPVAHGAYLSALASRLVGMYLPGRDALLLQLRMSFAAPVVAGSRVKVRGTIVQISEAVRSAVVELRIVEAETLTPLARGKLTVGLIADPLSEEAADA